jgi:hypothetical protein
MSAAAAIAPVRPPVCGQLISSEMLDTCAPVPASAKHPYLVYKIALFQIALFLIVYKSTCKHDAHESFYSSHSIYTVSGYCLYSSEKAHAACLHTTKNNSHTKRTKMESTGRSE